MGQREYITFFTPFDFGPFLKHLDDLGDLSTPFTNEEIDLVVAHMPNDRSPGLDGFSGLFLKYDFYKLCQKFCKSAEYQ
jgi:hypothetical protein